MSYLGQHFFIQCLQQDMVKILKGSPGKAYMTLPNYGYRHEMFNHSKNYVWSGTKNTDMSIHTNAIDGSWWQVKRWLPSAGKYCLKHCIPVFMWLSYYKNKRHNLFVQFLDLMAQFNDKVPSNHKNILYANIIVMHLICTNKSSIAIVLFRNNTKL